MRRFTIVAAVLALATGAVLEPAAWGAGTAAEGNDLAIAGNGQQYGAWSVTNKRLRLVSSPTTSMATTRCMDAMIDWSRPLGHYDSRVVRSCLPGVSEQTDPAGGGYWSETDPIFITNVGSTRMGWGLVIDDSNLSVLGWDHFDDTGPGARWTTSPGTGTQGYARVRTRYNNGTVLSCNPLPVTSASGSGGCS